MASTISKVLEDRRANKRVKPLELVRPNPELATMISKLVAAEVPAHYDRKGNRTVAEPQLRNFRNVATNTAQSIQDADIVMNILTDMDQCKQILVSATLSPKDMSDDINLRITGPEGYFSPALLGSLLNEIQRHFEQDYKIREVLPRILEDMFFNTGSYAVATIPENSIDEAINSHREMSMESFTEFFAVHDNKLRAKSMGILGPATLDRPSTVLAEDHQFSLEGYHQVNTNNYDSRILFNDPVFVEKKASAMSGLMVTDNLSVLKVPLIQQRLREEAISKIYPHTPSSSKVDWSEAFESIEQKEITDRELDAALYGQKKSGYRPILAFKTQEQLSRYSVGEPLILHLPSESVIPVFIPGTPEKQVGFFVLVDANGNPITRTSTNEYYQTMNNRLNGGSNFASAMLTKVQSMTQGFPSINDHQIDYSARYCQEIVEADLLARMRNGMYGNGVALANRPEIYRIMLARMLANQFTQLLFIPVEYMTYFAFQYSPDGIGQSYLDDLRVLNSMRAMALFTQVMTQVRNSIPRTNVNMTLDPDDTDPWKTIEILTHEIVRSRQQYFPLGMNSPADIQDWIQRAGLQFSYKNHPAIPEVGLEFTENQTNYQQVSTELLEYMNRQAIMKTGLTPDTVDAALHAEFATSIVRNSVMLSKRISKNQRLVEPLISDHGRKHMLTHGGLFDRLIQIVLNNFEEVDVGLALGQKTTQEAQDDLKGKIREKEVKRMKDAADPDQKDDKGSTEEEGNTEPKEGSTASIPYSVIKSLVDTEDKDAHVKLATDKAEKLDQYKKRYIAEEILKRFIRGIEFWLPRPDTTTEENLLLETESHSKLIDEVIESWFSEKLFTDSVVGPELAKNGEAIKANIKAYFMRDWFIKNGVLTEFADIATKDENGKPKLDLWEKVKDHFEAIIKPMTGVMTEIYKTQREASQVLSKLNPDNNGGGGTEDDTGGGATDEFGGGGGSEMPDLGDEEQGGGEGNNPPEGRGTEGEEGNNPPEGNAPPEEPAE